ncbi:MAG: molybdopterin-guanine dinucleotide biosynthesis protein B [Chloroflexi bacterium]|nr:molybdopterin-guanine dinucleotide biosynthesis protein B [Chloroflexota bacterium]
MTIPLVVISGFSGSGKTTVASGLVRQLAGRGYRVAAVKHAAHGHDSGDPRTDSERLFDSGAEAVVVSSPGALTKKERTIGDMPLDWIVEALGQAYHIVIAEGFKRCSAPKIWIHNGEDVPHGISHVVATVGRGQPRASSVPDFDRDDTPGLADFVERSLLQSANGARGFSLAVDGKSVELRPFVSATLEAMIRAFVGELKGMPAQPQSIVLTIEGPSHQATADAEGS